MIAPRSDVSLRSECEEDSAAQDWGRAFQDKLPVLNPRAEGALMDSKPVRGQRSPRCGQKGGWDRAAEGGSCGLWRTHAGCRG
jgi:hypothetical protein